MQIELNENEIPEHLLEFFEPIETSQTKPKDLIGIPWRVAFALQADGWYLRSAPPWIKRSAMPESVRDRATTAHEFWFQLAKSKKYYWDADAVRVGNTRQTKGAYRVGGAYTGNQAFNNSAKVTPTDSSTHDEQIGRNRRTSDFWNESLDARIAFYRDQLAHLEHVKEHGGILLDEGGDPLGLHINTQGYKGAHFATFGEKLIMPLILGGTSAKGCCPECGAPWVRVTEKTAKYAALCESEKGKWHPNPDGELERGQRDGPKTAHGNITAGYITTGWTPSCTCDAGPPVPCTVLDIFLGSGTTAATARRLGRNWVGIELNREYCETSISSRD
jgi:hypothetical protein